MIAKDKDGFNVDTLAVLYADEWMEVLAAPRCYGALQRPVDPAVLLQLLDFWIAYAERGDHYGGDATPDALRPALARRLRALIAAWTPPDLPPEISEAARAVLRAEWQRALPKRTTWDDHTCDPSNGRSLESYLIWSEGLPAILPKGGQ